ncbi:MAG TPA: M14 family zinc carboxypeptidase [Candidatus Hydrogenedentes bacterium]|nr:M14 family zinc carboxypeptidase [Candidatus Hydrogenedentota bacterium]
MALILALFSSVAAADGAGEARMALGAGPRTGDVYVVEVPVSGADAVAELARRQFDIASVRGDRVELHAVAEELALLAELGYAWRVLGRDGDGTKALDEYHGYASVTALLEAYAQAYPAIARLESAGQSVQGRELWVLYISDNPGVEEDEPEFKYTATIHGDEPLGTEMCLYLIDLLLSEYGQTPRITALVDSTAIAIMPLMNPDGREAGTRVNAHGVDLNRAFPQYPADYTGAAGDGEPLNTAGRQPEVARVMEWTAANRFVLSANFHTGSLLVNYPYDEDGVGSGMDAPTPDDALFEDVARRYSRYNLPMWNSAQFADGISNGSAWYAIFGSMQDWNYRYMACNDVTIELSYAKWPAASELPDFWDDNREAMLRYLEAVHIGVRGIVTDALTGQPVDARVTVQGNAQPVFTDPDVGDYHRMLLPGVYTLTVQAEGYHPRTFTNLTVAAGPATRADAALVPLGAVFDADVNNDGVVNAVDIQLVVNDVLDLPVPVDGDINGDGAVNAVDVQLVINAALVR